MPRRGRVHAGSLLAGLAAGALLVVLAQVVVRRPAPRTLRPLYHRLALVAGAGDPGTLDGPFAEARFHEPAGLAASPDGGLLVVADRGSHRLRAVRLGEANRVVTLAGTGQPGSRDGSLGGATFDKPTHVQFLGARRLVVWDAGTGLLRLVDLAEGIVRTLRPAGGAAFEDVGALAASETEVFLSQPEAGRLVRVDVASGLTRVLLEAGERVPHPAALALHGGTLYLEDRDGTEVFGVAAPRDGPAVLRLASTPGRLVAMTSSGGILYGLRSEAEGVLVRALTGENVPLVSAWGQDVPGVGSEGPFLEVPASPPVGFAADPRVGRTLFVSTPGLRRVLSVRDLDQGARRNALIERMGEPNDDSYPKRKPAGVYRILVVGDSHIFYGSGEENSQPGGFPRALTLPKRLELFLNTRAALEGRPTSYEVLTKGRGVWVPLCIWPVTEVPPLAGTWDVDVVLLMMPPASSTLEAWLNRPPGADGIPAAEVDPEYLLQAAEVKLGRSPAAPLFRACQKRGLAAVTGEGQLEIKASLGELAAVPELRREVLELFGRPLELLKKRLAPRRLVLCFYPSGLRQSLGEQRGFYRELCAARGIELLDLVPAFDVLREAYYPVSDVSGFDHFHAAGHAVLGSLLAHELVSRRLVPF